MVVLAFPFVSALPDFSWAMPLCAHVPRIRWPFVVPLLETVYPEVKISIRFSASKIKLERITNKFQKRCSFSTSQSNIWHKPHRGSEVHRGVGGVPSPVAHGIFERRLPGGKRTKNLSNAPCHLNMGSGGALALAPSSSGSPWKYPVTGSKS